MRKAIVRNQSEHPMSQTLLPPLPTPTKREHRRSAAALLYTFVVMTCSVTAWAAPTPASAPCQLRVLIVYADSAAPTLLQSQILAEPGVTAVDLFDASFGPG